MPGFSNTAEAYAISYLLKGFAFGDTLSIALFTAVSNVDTAAGTEVSGGSYARQAVTFGAVLNSAVKNNAIVTFPTATANWGTVTHFAIRSSDGYWVTAATPLTNARTINAGDTLSFPIDSIVVSFTS
jgi:hypothetical protein